MEMTEGGRETIIYEDESKYLTTRFTASGSKALWPWKSSTTLLLLSETSQLKRSSSSLRILCVSTVEDLGTLRPLEVTQS